MARLSADVWVGAYLRRLDLAGIPAFVAARGDRVAGAVMVVVATLDGRAQAWLRRFDFAQDARVWDLHVAGSEGEVAESVAAQRRFDPDLWVIEIEDRAGRHLLDEDGLA